MSDREKAIKILNDTLSAKENYPWGKVEISCRYIGMLIELLKKQEPMPPVHIHEEYPEHDWKKNENGEIDEFGLDIDYHNGPVCTRCHYSFCMHCNPNGWNDEPCVIDEYRCPKCRKYLFKGIKFCSDCGQAIKWDGDKADNGI